MTLPKAAAAVEESFTEDKLQPIKKSMKKLGGKEGKERFRGKKRQARRQGTVGCRLKELHSSKKVDWRQSKRKKKERTKGQVTPQVPQRPPNPPLGKGLANPPTPG